MANGTTQNNKCKRYKHQIWLTASIYYALFCIWLIATSFMGTTIFSGIFFSCIVFFTVLGLSFAMGALGGLVFSKIMGESFKSCFWKTSWGTLVIILLINTFVLLTFLDLNWWW